ncbi:hypothetical protein JCM5296_002351 [Sporobolomyces johnsonii]
MASATSLAPLFLYAVSSTLLVSLFFVPVFLARKLIRCNRSQRNSPWNGTNVAPWLPLALALSSAIAVVLSGICGLAALGNRRDGAIAGGAYGMLAVLLVDAYVLSRLFWAWSPSRPSELGRTSSLMWQASLCSLLFLTSVFHIVLLALHNPTRDVQMGVSFSRALLHLVFDIAVVCLLHRRLKKQLSSHSEVVDIEQGGGLSSTKGKPSEEWVMPADQSRMLLFRRLALLWNLPEGRILVLQLLSSILSILSIAFPIHRDYKPLESDGSRFVAPSLFGTTTSPAGYVVLSLLILARWMGIIFELASSSTSSNHSLPVSVSVERTGMPTPSPSTVPLTGARDSIGSRLSSPISAGPPSFGGSGVLEMQGPSPAQLRTTSPFTLSKPSSRRSRHLSIASTLSISKMAVTEIREEEERSREEGSSNEVHETYLHTESRPVPEFGRRSDSPEPEPTTPTRSRAPTPTPSSPLTRPRSASSPEFDYTMSSSPSTPRTIVRRLSKSFFNSPSSSASRPSSSQPSSPSRSRPSVRLSRDFAWHSASPATSDRSRTALVPSWPSSPSGSPTKSRRPSLLSKAGLTLSESPTSIASLRRSGSGSLAFLRTAKGDQERGGALEMEIDTGEDDPFAPMKGSLAIEAEKRVQEWEQRKSSETELPGNLKSTVAPSDEPETGGSSALEEPDQREAIERVMTPVNQVDLDAQHDSSVAFSSHSSSSSINTSPIAHLPRSSSRSSLFREHFDNDGLPALGSNALPASQSVPDMRSRSSLGSAFQLDHADVSRTRSRMSGKLANIFARPSLSPAAAAGGKLLGKLGARSTATPPLQRFSVDRTSSPDLLINMLQQNPPLRTHSSAPPPVSLSRSPERASKFSLSPAKRRDTPASRASFFPPSQSATSTPPAGDSDSTLPSSSTPLSRKNSTASSFSFSLRPTYRKATTGLGGSFASAATTRHSVASNLSFACRGDSRTPTELGESVTSLELRLDPRFAIEEVEASTEDDHHVFPSFTRTAAVAPTFSSTTTFPVVKKAWWHHPHGRSRPNTPYRPSPNGRLRCASRSAPTLLTTSDSSSSHSSQFYDQHELAPIHPRKGHRKSQSLTLDRFSTYRLAEPSLGSPFGSFTFLGEERPPSMSRRFFNDSPLTGAGPSSRNSFAFGSAFGSTESFVSVDSTPTWLSRGHATDRSISISEVDELTDLYQAFTPSAFSHAPSRSSILSQSSDHDVALHNAHRPSSALPSFILDPSADSNSERRLFSDRPLTPIPSASFTTPPPTPTSTVSLSPASTLRHSSAASVPPSPGLSTSASSLEPVSPNSPVTPSSVLFWLSQRNEQGDGGDEEELEGSAPTPQEPTAISKENTSSPAPEPIAIADPSPSFSSSAQSFQLRTSSDSSSSSFRSGHDGVVDGPLHDLLPPLIGSASGSSSDESSVFQGWPGLGGRPVGSPAGRRNASAPQGLFTSSPSRSSPLSKSFGGSIMGEPPPPDRFPSSHLTNPDSPFNRQHRRRRSSLCLSSSLPPFGSLVGSFENSLLSGRMSATPSKPLPFLASIGVLGGSDAPARLKCPPHLHVPFGAVYYSSEGLHTSSPYVGSIDLEAHYLSLLSPSAPPAPPSSRPAKIPRFPGYQIPPRGQIQLVLKNSNQTAFKPFLVPYDLTGLHRSGQGGRTFLRQKSYSVDLEHGDAKGKLRFAVHLQFCSPPLVTSTSSTKRTKTTSADRSDREPKYYLYHSIHVVFASRALDAGEKLRVVLEGPAEMLYGSSSSAAAARQTDGDRFASYRGPGEEWEIARKKAKEREKVQEELEEADRVIHGQDAASAPSTDAPLDAARAPIRPAFNPLLGFPSLASHDTQHPYPAFAPAASPTVSSTIPTPASSTPVVPVSVSAFPFPTDQHQHPLSISTTLSSPTFSSAALHSPPLVFERLPSPIPRAVVADARDRKASVSGLSLSRPSTPQAGDRRGRSRRGGSGSRDRENVGR